MRGIQEVGKGRGAVRHGGSRNVLPGEAQRVVELQLRLIESPCAKRSKTTEHGLDRCPSFLLALRGKAMVADPAVVVDQDAGPAGRLVFRPLDKAIRKIDARKMFGSLRLRPVGFIPPSARYARTISTCSLRSPSGIAAKSISGSGLSSTDVIAVPAILLRKSSGAISSVSGAESVWQSRLGRSFVDSF